MTIMMIMLALLSLEIIILMFMIYFATLPLFLFLFTMGLRMLSIFLLGFIIMFVIFTLLGIKPELTIEWWIMHVRELTKKPFVAILMSIGVIAISIIAGAALALLTERIFLLPIMKKMNYWVLTNLK